MMGGSGTRFGAEKPKQFTEVNGIPIFAYILKKYCSSALLKKAIVVCHADWVAYAREQISELNIELEIEVVAGGANRTLSVKNGLSAIAECSSSEDVTLIHDATHPYVDEATLPGLIEQVDNLHGATLGECQFDTVYEIDPSNNRARQIVPRETIVAGASPEVFRFAKLWEIFQSLSDEEVSKFSSIGALALAHGLQLTVVSTDLVNLKITHRHDLDVFVRLLPDYFPREASC
jgi:2-C-methyl-D-erythritol 4-phosphate cytidylyltransferase